MTFRKSMVIHTSGLLFVFMMCLASLLVYLRAREIRASMEKDALTFATLTAGPLCEAYENYYESGYFKFRELVLNLLMLDRNLIGVQIYTVNNKKLFDSAELEGKGTEEVKKNGAFYKRLKDICPTLSNSKDGEYYDMVFPYLEPWGWHRYSVRYLFTKKYLKQRLRFLFTATISLSFFSIIFASFISFLHTRATVRPLEKLTDAARKMSKGNFDTRIESRGRDEISILAEAFNEMSDQVKIDLKMLKSQKKILSDANVELKRLNELKSQFLASVSHELKTPLTSLKGYIDYIAQGKLGPLTDAQEKGLDVAKRNLNRLHKQILNLIDFSSFESGKIEVSPTPFHIDGIVREAVTNLDAKLTEKSIVYEENIPSDIPPVIADRVKILQVLENLIINAVKFTPSGGKISISCRNMDGTQKGKIRICVGDSGIGISEDKQKKIFEKFFQVKPKEKHKGLGLGLAISKSILDAHNETITVNSKKGKGSNFCFTLPIYK